MKLKEIKGLKYPDEYFIKFFFKNKLHEKENLKYLEFGCGNGSNLMLPFNMGGGNKVIGIDYDSSLIEYANFNFNLLENNHHYEFYSDDMRKFVQNNENIKADILLFPSVINYISKKDFVEFLKNIIQNNLIKNAIPFYIRFRTPKDFRFGLGKKLEYNSYLMSDDSITGEAGAINTFYTESEMLDILKNYLNISNYKIFHLDNQNEHSGEIVLNSDIAIWGTIN